jgi:DNA uptake protein ComE-like DNA-binding protein
MSIKEFFYMQKTDRRLMQMIVCGIIVAASVAVFFGSQSDESLTADGMGGDSTATASALPARQKMHRAGPAHQPYYRQEASAERALFAFDPNTADSTQLLRLGLKPWQVRNIYKYRSKGGVFREPRDFAKVYGLTVEQFGELEPYIRIAGDYRPASTLLEGDERPRPTATAANNGDTLPRTVKLKAWEQIPLNTTDTALLKRVPGIGSARAKAIVEYGKRLGGYHDVGQLLEIYGMPEEVLGYFSLGEAPQLVRINVNKLTLEQLRRHPYISYFQAKAIVDYRRLYGPLHSLQDLSLHRDFTPEAIERLAPYVEF